MSGVSVDLYDAADALHQAARSLRWASIPDEDKQEAAGLRERMRELAEELSAWAMQLEESDGVGV